MHVGPTPVPQPSTLPPTPSHKCPTHTQSYYKGPKSITQLFAARALYWQRALDSAKAPPVDTGVKAQLQRAKLLVFVGRVDEACEMYINGVAEHTRNAWMHNNAAICRLRKVID